MESLEQRYFKLPLNFHCRLAELYQGGTFLNHTKLQTLIRTRTDNVNFILTENSHLSLKNSLKYIIKNTASHDGVKVTFPNSVPLLNPRPPKHSSSNTLELYKRTKKGSKAYRRILDRDINFITNTRVNSWKKTLNWQGVTKDLLNKTFKGINHPDLTAGDNDALVRFFTKKTSFNYQNHKSHPDQATRPEWAHRLGCWACETQLQIFNLETPEHALVTCPLISHVRNEVLSSFGILNLVPQLTTNAHIMWGLFQAQPCNKNCTYLGNIINNIVTSEILKLRNKKKADPTYIGKKIREKISANVRAKPNGSMARELVEKNLWDFFHNPRPPDLQ